MQHETNTPEQRRLTRDICRFVVNVTCPNPSEVAILKLHEEMFCSPTTGRLPVLAHVLRSKALRWMAEVLATLESTDQVYFLSVNYFDRATCVPRFQESQLQTVALVCMWIACKHESRHGPTLNDFMDFCAEDVCTPQEACAMEHVVLDLLSFRLTSPTVVEYLRHFSLCGTPLFLAQYMAQWFSTWCHWVLYPSWMVALCAVLLALFTLHLISSWPVVVANFVGKYASTMRECMRCMHSTHILPDTTHEIYLKFYTEQTDFVALVPSRPLLSEAFEAQETSEPQPN